MKTLMIASAVALAGLTMPAFAGPSVGSTSFHTSTFGARPTHVTRITTPYALKGRIEQRPAQEYRWRLETHRLSGRAEHTVFVREAVR